MSAKVTADGWRPETRFAFRFFCVYVLVAWLPEVASALGMSGWSPLKDAIGAWVINYVLRLPEHSLVPPQPAGGTWLPTALAALVFVLGSLVVALAWTALDRARCAYSRLHAWMHLTARFTLAYVLLGYGLGKVLPSQFGPPGFQLLFFSQQTAQLSPQGLLWAFMGASREYTVFAGLVETAGALLLLPHRTATLGALISVAAMTHVVILNVAYDVVVKVLALQMLLIAVCVLAPDLPRLVNLLVLNRQVLPRPIRPLFANPRHARLARIVGILSAVSMVYSQWDIAENGATRKSRAAQVPLYGMWDVTASTESIPWRRFVVPYEGTGLAISPSESARLFRMRVDASGKTLDLTPNTLSRTTKPGPAVRFRYEQPSPDNLVLHSESTGGVTHLRLVPSSTVPLVSHRHRWYW